MQRVVVRHFTLVLVTLTAYFAISLYLGLMATGHRPAVVDWHGIVMAMALQFPPLVLGAAATAAAIAVALLAFRPGAMRTAVAILAGVTVAQVGYDVFGKPAMSRAEHAIALQAPVWPIRPDSSPLTFHDTLGTLRRLLAFGTGQVRVEDVQPTRPPGSNAGGQGFTLLTDDAEIVRVHAMLTVHQSFDFLVPFITMGLVMGLGSWLKRHAAFRPRSEGLVVRVAVAWLLPFVVTTYVLDWGRNADWVMNTHGQSLAWLLLPLIPALVLATLGWRSAARASRAFA